MDELMAGLENDNVNVKKMPDIDEMGELRQDVETLHVELLKNHRIDPGLYEKYDVKRGLRDSSGKGVLTGLTEISDVSAYATENGKKVPADGNLYYQGVNVQEIVKGLKGRRFGFEETIYLLLFGKLPNEKELEMFLHVLFEMQHLGSRFVRDVVMKASNSNIMNALQRCVLTLYTYDSNPDDISVQNVLRQSLELINKLPLIAVYSYRSYCHFRKDETLMIRNPKKGLSLAENILLMLRPFGEYTELEAKVLDIALILHAEHGGANLKVQNMFKDIKKHVKDWTNEGEVADYLNKILDKEAFDHSGLIYGMGHAVYTLSDSREVILKDFAKRLAAEKGMTEEFALYETVEKIAGKLIMERRKVFKNVCANVDFYSGFVYTMLGIPEELFTPIFAIARIPGWCAHRLEELINANKIIRPAYMYVGEHVDYRGIDMR